MQKTKLVFTFTNPNTHEETIRAIKEMIIEHIVYKVKKENYLLTKNPT